jgi:rhodanese-related sulfurtransferase
MREITPAELRDLIASGDVHLIDVREPYEHDEFNIGGINIPLGELIMHIDEIKALSGEKEIALYCRSGNRSAMAQKLLRLQHGIDHTLNLTGGLIAWKKEINP